MVTVGFDYEIYNVTENEKRVVVCVRLFEGITEREFTVNATVISNRTASKSLSLFGLIEFMGSPMKKSIIPTATFFNNVVSNIISQKL